MALGDILRAGEACLTDSDHFSQDEQAGKVVAGILGDTGAGKSCDLGQLSEEKVLNSITASPRLIRGRVERKVLGPHMSNIGFMTSQGSRPRQRSNSS